MDIQSPDILYIASLNYILKSMPHIHGTVQSPPSLGIMIDTFSSMHV